MVRLQPNRLIFGALLSLWAWGSQAQELTAAQVSGPLSERRALTNLDDPGIGYSIGPFNDAIADLNRRLANGSHKLRFDPETGYPGERCSTRSNSARNRSFSCIPRRACRRLYINASNPRAWFSRSRRWGYPSTRGGRRSKKKEAWKRWPRRQREPPPEAFGLHPRADQTGATSYER